MESKKWMIQECSYGIYMPIQELARGCTKVNTRIKLKDALSVIITEGILYD